MSFFLFFLLILGSKFSNAQVQLYACDENGNGTASFNLQQAEAQILQSLPDLNVQEEVWITKRKTGIAKVVQPSTAPQLIDVCPANATLSDFYELAINSAQEIYVSFRWDLYRVNTENCQYIHITNQLPTNVIAMSFDNQDNLYAGGLNTSIVYRAEAGDFNNWSVWHDFGNGVASGDYVMIGEYMYIAWRTGGQDVLYKVTVDEDNQYVSHEVLGSIYPDTYGMAGENGQLYGVTRDQLYRINLSPFSTQLVYDNPSGSWEDNWLGAAGLHEAVFYDISFHHSQQEAQSGQNPITDYQFTNTTPGLQMLYAQIADQNGVTIGVTEIHLNVIQQPATSNYTQLVCENSATFQPQDFNQHIAADAYTFTYHSTLQNAEDNQSPLSTLSFTGTSITYFVRVSVAENCYSIAQLDLQPAETPELDIPLQHQICPGEAYTIHAPGGFQQYLWSGLHADDIAANNLTSSAITITQPAQITLSVTNAFGCSTTQNISVIALPQPQIVNIIDQGNSIQIVAENAQNAEYSIDGTNWQQSPVFTYDPGTEITVHVRTQPACYIITRDFISFISYNVITPNGDGKNDVWQPLGLENYPDAEVQIFNRYGKLLFSQQPRNGIIEWRGKYLGRPLPSGTYWYIIRLTPQRVESGHITLINK
ncbi:MAG: T9SS type B sorting domain-containing protein [Weeksellaceae bacterium]|nr:T9SS type B sorting domain-containing protein [Weeksellaceae bacterium]